MDTKKIWIEKKPLFFREKNKYSHIIEALSKLKADETVKLVVNEGEETKAKQMGCYICASANKVLKSKHGYSVNNGFLYLYRRA